MHYYGPNRFICSVLEEMRQCYETRNFSYLPGLIEEAQSLVNRMESALHDQQDVENLQEQLSEFRKDHKRLSDEIAQLQEKKRKLEKEVSSD